LAPFDIEGNDRPFDGDGDGWATVDMGAYEFMTVNNNPILALSRNEVVFILHPDREQIQEQTLTIQNPGAGILDWEIAEDVSWIQVTPGAGTTDSLQSSEVTVQVNGTDLGEGRYEYDMIIEAAGAENSPQAVTVRLLKSYLYVPSEYPTIQGAIDVAVDGDIIILADGTYTGAGNRDIRFKGKAITVRSLGGADKCIIDCQGSEKNFHRDLHRGFIFFDNETPDSVIDGLTIKNGYHQQGGGIYLGSSDPTITNCIFVNNTAKLQQAGQGGAIELSASAPVISNCLFIHNSAFDYGGSLNIWSISYQLDSHKFSRLFSC